MIGTNTDFTDSHGNRCVSLRFPIVYYGPRFYNPPTGRWLNLDPINELGFKLSTPNRKTFDHDEELNLYLFVANRPVNIYDAIGLAIPKEAEDCYGAHPLYPSDPVCNKYGNRKYLGASLKCFCKFPLLRDTWSNYVRGCLACMDAKGVAVSEAHKACYESADKNYNRPTLVLAAAWCSCRK